MSIEMEKTDALLATILQKAMDGAATGSDFLAGQLPDLVKQVLVFNGIFALVWTIIGVIGILGAIPVFRWAKEMFDEDEDWFPLFLIPGALALISSIVGLTNFFNYLKITLAPKLWLLEYAASLVRH